MKHILLVIWLCFATSVAAQDFSGLARIDMGQSQVRDAQGGMLVDLHLSQTVPFRVFTLDEPRRLVLDFREIDWQGVSRSALLNADNATDIRFGTLRPGWSRMVIDLNAPLRIDAAGMEVDPNTGTAHLQVLLLPTNPKIYATLAGVPAGSDWDSLIPDTPSLPAPPPADDQVTIVIDPGHGGIDPGANRGGVIEARIMLQLGIEVTEALNRAGFRALLTREADVFVPLEERMTRARSAHADLLISLHADALEQDQASGASVYTLNAKGADIAAQRMAERHERGDLLAGLDLKGQDDRVVTLLMELARLESAPRGARFADLLVAALRDNGARLNSRPRREGRFAVLNAADFASVLVEVGFLSNAEDRADLASPDGRARITAAIVQAVQAWATEEEIRAPLLRQ